MSSRLAGDQRGLCREATKSTCNVLPANWRADKHQQAGLQLRAHRTCCDSFQKYNIASLSQALCHKHTGAREQLSTPDAKHCLQGLQQPVLGSAPHRKGGAGSSQALCEGGGRKGRGSCFPYSLPSHGRWAEEARFGKTYEHETMAGCLLPHNTAIAECCQSHNTSPWCWLHMFGKVVKTEAQEPVCTLMLHLPFPGHSGWDSQRSIRRAVVLSKPLCPSPQSAFSCSLSLLISGFRGKEKKE